MKLSELTTIAVVIVVIILLGVELTEAVSNAINNITVSLNDG